MKKKKKISRQRKWQLLRLKKGKCFTCGENVSKKNKSLCEKHRKWRIDYYGKWRKNRLTPLTQKRNE